MDMLSQPPQSKQPEANWPATRAVKGVTYNIGDNHGDRLSVMTTETWLDFGTLFEAQRRKVEQQDKTLIQLRATNDVLVKQLAELKAKHDNLRAAVKHQRKAAFKLV